MGGGVGGGVGGGGFNRFFFPSVFVEGYSAFSRFPSFIIRIHLAASNLNRVAAANEGRAWRVRGPSPLLIGRSLIGRWLSFFLFFPPVAAPPPASTMPRCWQ